LREIADRRFRNLGLKVSFGKHVEEKNEFNSSSVESRIEDLHEAFADKNVKAIFTVIGGYNSNQLLKHIDWQLIKNNPKILCGYSDITVLNNAIYAKAGLINYYGPHYSTFGQEKYFEYTLDYCKKCLFFDEPFQIEPSENWSDDLWFKDQNKRTLIPNEGWLIVNEGETDGIILGGNLCTFNLLQGTEFFPDISGSILFLEDDDLPKENSAVEFDRNLQSLIQQANFKKVNGLVIGRFQKASQITNEKITQIIKSKKELANIPIIANVDFGHTDPKITLPIGGEIRIKADFKNPQINIAKH
jgi:muramoyltetrapeptide carboxypeptidase LdcA involved in peptidoglycan recycling